MDHLKEKSNTLDELEQLLRNHDLPAPNPALLAKVQQLCSGLKGTDRYIDEKSNAIASRAARFYSVRTHGTYPGGAEALHHDIAYDLPHRIRQAIACLQHDAPR